MYQNYQTIDKYRIARNLTVRVSHISEELEDSKRPAGDLVETDEFVVAIYYGFENGENSSLVLCEHFKGEHAEFEAMQYYLSLVDSEEFPAPELSEENYKSWLKDRHYVTSKFQEVFNS